MSDDLPKDPDEARRMGADLRAAADEAWKTSGAAPDPNELPPILRFKNGQGPKPQKWQKHEQAWAQEKQAGPEQEPPRVQQAKTPKIAATPFVWIDPASIPKREFLYGRHYIRGSMSTTIAPGGVGKTSLSVVEALAMASGKPLLGVQPEQRLSVWLCNLEEPLDELQRRVMATALRYGLTPEDFDGRLFVDSGQIAPIILAEQTRDGTKIFAFVVEDITAAIRQNNIDVMIIDPFVSSHRVTENDNGAIDRVAKTWSAIAAKTNAAIEIVHHSRKTGGAEVTVEDGRGASAHVAASRSARVLNVMSETEATKAVENRRLFFRVDNGKSNVAPSDAPEWYKLESTELGNGDNVGVAMPWKMPNPFDSITKADLRAAQKAVSEGGPWRADPQADDWVGKPIAEALKRDINDPDTRRDIKAMLKIWIKNGMFKRVEVKDPNSRKTKPCIEVGEWATD